MLRLHQAMVEMVTDLVNLVSPSPNFSQLKSVVMDVSPTISPLLSPDSAVSSDYSPPEPSSAVLRLPAEQKLLLPTKKDESHTRHVLEDSSCMRKELSNGRNEQLCLPKEGRKEHTSCTRKDTAEDAGRKEQQQHIQQLVAFIDERAAYYGKSNPASIREPYPRVEWGRINPHTRRNLPQPIQLPVYSCPRDPYIYPDYPNPKGRIMECYRPTTQCFIPGCEHTECLPPTGSTTKTSSGDSSSNTFNAVSRNEKGTILLNKAYKTLQITSCPFGTAAGFETNLGVVAPPVSPIGGYIYTEKGWKLHATPGW